MQVTHIYNPYSVSKKQSNRLTSFVSWYDFENKVNNFVKFKNQNKMETIELGKYTLKYYLGVYLSTDDERYFRCVCHQKKGRAGWSCTVNGNQMSVNEYLGVK